MRKPIFFLLFCASGFCVGYLFGVPFFKPSPVPVTAQDPVDVEESGLGFIPLAPASLLAEPAPAKERSTPSKKTIPSNPSNAIANLTLQEVQTRLEGMNGMLVTEATDEMEQLLVSRWAKLDPMGAAQYAADAVAQGGNPRLLQASATAWAKTDPVGAAQWAASLDSPLARDTALGQIFNTWSSTNPLQAAAAIDSLPMGTARTIATSAVAKNFAKGDLAGAVQWADTLTGPLQIAAAREIVNLWAASDPAATGAWIMGQNSQQVRSEAFRQLAGNWVSRDPSGAFDYAGRISDPSLQADFIKSAMQRFSSMDPVSAADWLSSASARPHAGSLVADVSSRWAAFDPGAASTWASSISDTSLRNKALSAVTTSWSQFQPADTAAWIGSLKDAPSKDVAIAAYSVQIAKANPSTGAQWAAQISDPAKLRSSMNRIVGDWKKIDPNAARLFVQSSNVLPPDLKQRLLR